MTTNLKINLEPNKTYTDWGSSIDGGTFTFETGSPCGTDASCMFNNNTVMKERYPDYGFHYNWYAATAGTGSLITSATELDATGSICPKGWRIPAYNSTHPSKSYYSLMQIYGNTQGIYLVDPFKMYENYGAYYGGSLHLIIEFSSAFWTSTSTASTSAEIFYHYRSADLRGWTRVSGMSLRCINI